MNEFTFQDLIVRNCREVFQTMLDISIAEVPLSSQTEKQDVAERVVSLISFAGDYTGNCMISCSQSLACKLASAMLAEEYRTVSGEVMDAVGEISNMVFGNVKTDLEEHLGPLQLSIPTVIVGREFNVRSLANPSWMIVPLNVGNEVLEACMSISENPAKLSARNAGKLALVG